MPDRPTVIVGVDGSSPARAALRWAVRHSELTHSRVWAVAAYEQPLAATGAMTPIVADGELEAQARRWLDEAIAELPNPADASVVPRAVAGDARSVLLEYARNAELLVLGNSARGAVAAAVAGSVALSCAHHAHCPVVLVPDEDLPHQEGHSRDQV